MHDISLILLVTFGLTFALFFGLLTNRLGLSPIVGYLLAGVMVGPYTPGFVADPNIASQLAEIGVILLMFGVGLHFHVEDLNRVRSIALPGAIFQIVIAVGLALFVGLCFGLPISTGIIIGIAISVASTVVLVRVLTDNKALHSAKGHIAVGWLIVEDIFTVIILVLLPVLKEGFETGDFTTILLSVGLTFLKVIAMIFIVLLVGKRVVPRIMNYVAGTRSRELFTLSVLVVALGLAAGSALLFGVSMALGAFLAGMVVGQSDVSHQAASDALPMKDAFAVLFFVSVGMLFDPSVAIEQWQLTLALLFIILIGKPLAALFIIIVLGYPLSTALTVSIALAQIGEFSFILSDMARHLGLLRAHETSVIVTCALISITVNPLIFKAIPKIERWVGEISFLNRILNKNNDAPDDVQVAQVKAVVVGFGPVGQTLYRLLSRFDVPTSIVDFNIETIQKLREENVSSVYGDASSKEILTAAGLENAEFLLVTLNDDMLRAAVVSTAKQVNPTIRILVRAHFLNERGTLEEMGVKSVAYEEAEVSVALAEMLLKKLGVQESKFRDEISLVREEISLGNLVLR